MCGAIMECRNIDGTISWNLDSSNIAIHTGLPVGIRICVDRFVLLWTHRAKKHKEKIWGNKWILEIWENKWIIKFAWCLFFIYSGKELLCVLQRIMYSLWRMLLINGLLVEYLWRENEVNPASIRSGSDCSCVNWN